jgi:hypothetical protein
VREHLRRAVDAVLQRARELRVAEGVFEDGDGAPAAEEVC